MKNVIEKNLVYQTMGCKQLRVFPTINAEAQKF